MPVDTSVARKLMQRMLSDDDFSEEKMEQLANELIMCVTRSWQDKIDADRFLSDEAREAICNWWDDKYDIEPGDWQKFPSQHTDVELVRWVCDRLCESEHPEEYEEYRHILANDRALAEYVKYRPEALAEHEALAREVARRLSGKNS